MKHPICGKAGNNLVTAASLMAWMLVLLKVVNLSTLNFWSAPLKLSALMIVSSLLSFKEALKKFKVDKFTPFKSSGFGITKVDWSFIKRVKTAIVVMVSTNVPIISLQSTQ